MSDYDQSQEVYPPGDVNVNVSDSIATPDLSDAVTLRVGGMPFYDSYTYGEDENQVTITRNGTTVPKSEAEGIIKDAALHGVPVEVVSGTPGEAAQ